MELCSLIWNKDNHSVSAFLCIHAQLLPARRYGHLNLGLAKIHYLELPVPHLHILQELGVVWVLGWIWRENEVFALTRRVRLLDGLWYLSTSKTILTFLAILLWWKTQANLLTRRIWLFDWRTLYTFVLMNDLSEIIVLSEGVLLGPHTIPNI